VTGAGTRRARARRSKSATARARGPASPRWVLSLYVTGSTRNSLRAIDNLRRICTRHLDGDYALEVVDIYQQPEIAARADLIAAPTLVKRFPLPVRRLIGDLSDEARVLTGLGLPRPAEAPCEG
jgi:circadian clock protein KaiB